MKLTPLAQGHRVRHANWSNRDHYIDVRLVKEPDSTGLRTCRGDNQEGRRITFWTRNDEDDWIDMGSTRKLKAVKKT